MRTGIHNANSRTHFRFASHMGGGREDTREAVKDAGFRASLAKPKLARGLQCKGYRRGACHQGEVRS